MIETWRDEYSIVEWDMDGDGIQRMKAIFKPNMPHESLLWNLAEKFFGHGNWRVTTQTMRTEFPTGPWHAEYEVGRC